VTTLVCKHASEPDRFPPALHLAQRLTKHWPLLCQHIPEFARLTELAKLVAMAKLFNAKRTGNRKLILLKSELSVQGLKSLVKEWDLDFEDIEEVEKISVIKWIPRFTTDAQNGICIGYQR
jgi:hypothetical protein